MRAKQNATQSWFYVVFIIVGNLINHPALFYTLYLWILIIDASWHYAAMYSMWLFV